MSDRQIINEAVSRYGSDEVDVLDITPDRVDGGAWVQALVWVPIDDDGLQQDEIVNLQELIDSGMAWRLEGSVGRSAAAAIEDGVCVLGVEGHRDYWGNYVPSRSEVVPGTKGSVEYAEAMS